MKPLPVLALFKSAALPASKPAVAPTAGRAAKQADQTVQRVSRQRPERPRSSPCSSVAVPVAFFAITACAKTAMVQERISQQEAKIQVSIGEGEGVPSSVYCSDPDGFCSMAS